MQTVTLFQIPIVAEPRQQVWEQVVRWVQTPPESYALGTTNPEQLMLAQKNPAFTQQLQQLDYVLPDGEGVVWASRILQQQNQGNIISERITGIDLLADLIQLAEEKNFTVLIVGGRDLDGRFIKLNSGQKALIKEVTFDTNQKIKIAGTVWWTEGYQDVHQPKQSEDEFLERVIARLQPEIVAVAFGAPHQERWLVEWRARLKKSGVRVGVTVGGAVDTLTGKIPRAPQSWQNLHLEWLWRLIQEPWRWRRQLALIQFVSQVLIIRLNIR